jgi:hypothetical protein
VWQKNKMISDRFDILIVGSGPISIIEACYQANEGKKILITEEKESLGGAWGTINALEYTNLEIGCHIWSYSTKAYDFIQKFLDVKLEEMNPSPKISFGNITVHYDYKNPALNLKLVKNHFQKKNYKKAISELFFPQHFPYHIIPQKYMYPRGGAGEFINKLINKTQDFNIEIITGAKVNDVAIFFEKNPVEATINGQLFSFKEIYFTSHSHIHKLKVNDKEISINHNSSSFYHYHLVFSGNSTKKQSYLRVMNDAIIHRISDITTQLEFWKENTNNRTILIVGVFPKAIENTDENILLKLICKKLKKYNFITDKSDLLACHLNKYGMYRNDLKNNLPDDVSNIIKVHTSTDLMFGVAANVERWKEKLLK